MGADRAHTSRLPSSSDRRPLRSVRSLGRCSRFVFSGVTAHSLCVGSPSGVPAQSAAWFPTPAGVWLEAVRTRWRRLLVREQAVVTGVSHDGLWVWVGPRTAVRPLQINQMSGGPLDGAENKG